jgi:tetratricopeptide (TPR) repeat protein
MPPAEDGTTTEEPQQPEPVRPVWHVSGETSPSRRRLREAGFFLGLAYLVVLGAALLGWVGGITHDRITSMELGGPALSRAGQPGASLTEQRRRLEQLLASHGDDPAAQIRLASLYARSARAEPTPQRRALYETEAAAAADAAWALFTRQRPVERPFRIGTTAFGLRLRQADILGEIGREQEAIEIYEQLLADNPKAPADHRSFAYALLLNNCAWLLVTAETDAIHQPQRAHRLAIRCAKTSPEASRTSAFLDTLAMTYYTIGNVPQALQVQREALVRAGPDELPELLQHFDQFRTGAED